MPNVPQGNFSTLLTEDGHPNVPLPRTFRQLSEGTSVVQPDCITYVHRFRVCETFDVRLFLMIVFCSTHLLYHSLLTKNIALSLLNVNTIFYFK